MGPRDTQDPAIAGRLEAVLACPECRGGLKDVGHELHCRACEVTYPLAGTTPILLRGDHPLRDAFTNDEPELVDRIRRYVPVPEARVWTNTSQRALTSALRRVDPSDPERLVVHIGAGIEKAMSGPLATYPQIVTLGLPHRGDVDVVGDLQELPLTDASLDMSFSSSVLEHVADPERAVAEIARVTRPSGLVYAEVPFLRGFHMAPNDYQRYTVTGLEGLFTRHGFQTLQTGISSGPANAWALLARDTLMALMPGFVLKGLVYVGLGWLVHPIKYLDRLWETATWAEFQACTFFFLGRRRASDGDTARDPDP